ncbi:MAG: AMP-binding protein [Variibacter sp.]|nr:AMP-binding protein [Variibacter sp.]
MLLDTPVARPTRAIVEPPPAPSSADDTLLSLLARNAATHARRVALRERDLGIWHEYTWRDYLDQVVALAAGLEALGFEPAEPMLVIGDNRARLYFAMLAAAALRGVPAPIYPEVPPEELAHFARERARFAIAEDQEQVDKLLELRARTGAPEYIIYDDPRGLAGYAASGLIDYETVVARGRARLKADPGLAADLIARAGPDDGAVLLHSSGTTGRPKGVLLKHRRVLAAIRNAAAADYFREGEEYVAYLPMAWIGDFVFSVGAAIALRFVVSIPEGQETVLRDLREIAPTLYFASARSWDNLLTRLQVGIDESTPLKRGLVAFFMRLAIDIERRRLAGERPRPWWNVLRGLGELVVYGPIKDHLGLGRAHRCYTAGEAIGEDTFLFFRALGLNLKQFYGQTENCALTAAQDDARVRLHTVGRALPGVEIRIDENGEVLIRAESVFDGYVDDPDATARTLVDGWLRTGDAGYLEPDGELVILGRVGEVVHTSAGERFIPNYIENRIKFSQYVRDVAVLGAGRPFLAAIVCIDMEAVGHWAQVRGVAYTSYADLSQKPEVYALVQGVLRHVNGVLPPPLRLRRFVNLHKAFDPDDGEVTRTRKLRRNVIEKRYAQIIDAIYAGASEIEFEARITYETGESGVLRRRLTIMDVGA